MSRKNQQFDLNRRRFLTQSAAAASGAAVAIAGGKRSMYAWADAQQVRPCLISIHLPGGWDTNWFHMAFKKTQISHIDNPNNSAWVGNDGVPLPAAFWDSAFPNPDGKTADTFGRAITATPFYNPTRTLITGGTIDGFAHGAYTERTLASKLYRLPTSAEHYLGIGAQNAFGDGSMTGGVGLGVFTRNVCTWKGVYSGGAHDIPNQNIIHGNTSQYSIPFSGLVADSLATNFGGRLDLHYLQLTESPSVYKANWAMSKGNQIPINCADHNALVGLTQKAAADYTDAGLYDSLNNAILRLGGEIGKNKLSLSASKSMYQQFMDAFSGALKIAKLGAGMGSFLQLWADYANYALQRVNAMNSPAFLDSVSPDVLQPYRNHAWNYHLYAPVVPGVVLPGDTNDLDKVVPTTGQIASFPTDLTTMNALLSTPFTADTTSLNLAYGNSPTAAVIQVDAPNLRIAIARTAWKFAMAEYMIANNLSCVVDMAIGTADAHDDNSTEHRLLTIVYSLYAKLLSNLEGNQLINRTTVVVFSDFDRSAAMTTQTSPLHRGTNHDLTCSVLLAGAGVNRGAVVGDRLYTPELSVPGPAPYLDSGGAQVTYRHVFPTIMQIFGRNNIPANQLTEGSFVAEVLASDRR